MSPLQKSLTYDVVVLTLSIATAAATHGSVRGVAVIVATTTLLKAPYDAWEARRGAADRGE